MTDSHPQAIVVGPDRGVLPALEDDGISVVHVPTPTDGPTLTEAGLDEAAVLFVTDPEEATLVPVASERNPDLRIIWYAPAGVPAFITSTLDLGVDPALVEPPALVEGQFEG